MLEAAKLMAQPETALTGVTVLDLSENIAGPYCGRLLADYGAEVIKVERPGTGDASRRLGPFFHDEPHPDKGGLFLHLNANKRSVALDLRSAAGRRLFLRLVEEVDVVVESFPPTAMQSLGLDYERLREVNPALIVASISNFGQTGPYRDFSSAEIVTYAMGGPMYATGLAEREPMKLGGNILQYQAGAAAAAATAIAHWTAEETGVGEHLDLSLMRVQASNQDRRTTMMIAYQYTGEVCKRRGQVAQRLASGVRPCSDGYLHLIGDHARFPLIVEMIGQPELLEDPRFKEPADRAVPGRGEEFDEYLIPWMLERTKREAFLKAQNHRIPSGPINSADDVLEETNFRDRGVWDTVAHPATGPIVDAGRPFIMERTPWRRERAAPRLGEHNREVLSGLLGLTAEEIGRLRQGGVI